MANARTPRKLVLAAAAARGLADPTRLRILALLESRGPMCLMDIMAALNLKQPIASHHTSVLLGLKMVDRVKDGRFMMYSLGRRSTRRVLDDIHAAIAAQQPQPAGQVGADLVVIPEATEPTCNCMVPIMEGAGQHAPDCAIFAGGEGADAAAD